MIDISKQKTKKYYQHCKDCKYKAYKAITINFEQAVCIHATQKKYERTLINYCHVQECKKNKWKKEVTIPDVEDIDPFY